MQHAVVALCRQYADRSAERSCVEPALSAQLRPVALLDAEYLAPQEQQGVRKQSWMVLPVQAELRPPQVAEAAEQLGVRAVLPQERLAQAAVQELRASQPQAVVLPPAA